MNRFFHMKQDFAKGKDHLIVAVEAISVRNPLSSEPFSPRFNGEGVILIDWPTMRGRPARSGFERFGKGP